MKRAIFAVVIVGLLSSQAYADERETWQIVFASSLALTAGGAVTWWYGADEVDEAKQALCDGGAYPSDRTCMGPIRLTAEEIDRLNDKGDRGVMYTRVGPVITAAGLGLASFSFYKWMTAKPKETAVAITPTVSRDGAGAQLLLRW